MKIKVPSQNTTVYFLILIAIFRPAYIPYTWLNFIYRAAQAIGLLYLLLITFSHKLKNSKLILLFGAYYWVLLLSTFINSGNIEEVIKEILTTLLVVLWVHNASEKNPKSCVNQLMIVFSVLIFANLLTVIFFPTGLYKSADAVVSARYGWLLGHQSLFSMYAAPAICISALYWNNHRNLRSFLYLLLVVVACVIQITILGSANNLMCIAIIAVGIIGMCVLKMKKFDFKLVYVGVAILVLVISVFQATEFMKPFVTKYLHRDMTFTQRTFIWERALAQSQEHWLIGAGVQTGDTLAFQLEATHAHNQYLQCLYLGGIILLVIFLMILIKSFENLEDYAHTFAGKVMISAVTALMVQMIFEVYFHHTMGKVLIVLSFYFGQLCVVDKKDLQKSRRKRIK